MVSGSVTRRKILSRLRILAWPCALLGASNARAVAPNLASVAPAGGQRGSTVEVTLRGERLEDAQEILFYGPGITVEKIAEPADKQLKATLRIAADCRLGEHALRLRTAGGISPLRIFYVGPFPTLAEKEPNNTVPRAQAIPLNTTVQGTIENEDVDYFSVEARQGQRLSVEIEGARLGRTMFDPTLSIQDGNGRILARSDDTPLLGHDGWASIIAPLDGRYTIQVRDMTYTGAGHAYRLHVGNFPRPAGAFPPGGRAGEKVAVKFIGDVAGDFVQEVTLPEKPLGRFGVVAEHDGIAPSPNWIRVANFPNAADVAAGDTLATAPALEVAAPFAFNGVLETTGKAAFFRFKAKKDQHLEFQVYARRLGSPLDSVLTVFDAKGKNLGSNDDASGFPDSMVRVRMPADGDYTVKVADQLNRGGPLFIYRAEITEVRPALVLSIPDTARYDNETRKSIVVPRGNRFAVLMNIARDGFNGNLDVAFERLPAGITMRADTVPGSLSAVPVVFEAAAEAPLTGGLLTPLGKPAGANPGPEVDSRFRHTVEWVRIQNNTVYVQSEVNQIAAAVVEEVPFKVSIVEPKVPLVQSGEMTLQIVAGRTEGFDEPITVKMLWNPPGVSALPDMVIPKGASTVAYKLNSTNQAQVRHWKIAVVASATVKGGTAYVSSPLTDLEIAPPYLSGTIAISKIERGQSAKISCILEQKIPFEGPAVARLVGLPANVSAPDVEITHESTAAVFELTTTDKTPVGLTKNVFCNVVINRGAEPISHVIAGGSTLRIDAPRGKPTAAVPGGAAPLAAMKKDK